MTWPEAFAQAAEAGAACATMLAFMFFIYKMVTE
jgi:hypothetical protein